jgi:uncharacterized protein (TIGR02588 family)
MTRPEGESSHARRRSRGATPLLEWISAAIGLAITLGILGYLGSQLRSQRERLPALSVEVGNIVTGPTGYTADITIRNASPATAAHVHVEGTLQTGNEVRRSVALLDYVPGHSSRRAGLTFEEDPSRGNLEVRVIGYTEP